TRIVNAQYVPGAIPTDPSLIVGPKPNARLLDDQWLYSLLETGAVGVFGLLWLFGRSIRRLARVARDDDDDDGWLALPLASAIAGFALSMLTFDAFGFIQVTILLFMLLAISAVLLRLRTERAPMA